MSADASRAIEASTGAPTPPAPWAVSRARSQVEELATTVGFALRALTEPTAPPPALVSGQLRRTLHAALGRLPLPPATLLDEAWAATRVACAYLAAGDVWEAQQALLAANDALIGQHLAPGTVEPVTDGLPQQQQAS